MRNTVLRRRTLFFSRGVLLLCLLLASAPNSLAERDARPSPSPSVEAGPPSSPTPPPLQQSLPEIATGTDELKRLLQEVERRVTDDSDRTVIAETVKKLGPEFEARAQQADDVLRSLPSLLELQDLYTEWLMLSTRLITLRTRLANDGAKLTEDITWLNAQQSKWTTILGQIETDPSLAELRGQITQSLSNIQRTRTLADDRLKLNVTLQTRVSEKDQLVTGMLERISNQRILLQRGLLHADTNPLWDFNARRQTDLEMQGLLPKHYERDWIRSREFISTRRDALVLAGLIVLLTLAIAVRMRRLLPHWIEKGIVAPAILHVFQRPISLALFIGLLATLPIFPIAPAGIRGLISVLLIVPTWRLVGPRTTATNRPLLFTLILSALLVEFIRLMTASPSLRRDLLALSALAIGCTVAWLLLRMRRAADRLRLLVRLAAWVGMVLMFIALVANVFGYFALSQVLTDACLIGAYYGVVLYAAKEIAIGVLSTLMQTETAQRLASLRENTSVVLRWLRVLFSLAASITLIISLLRLFTVRDLVLATLAGWLHTPLVSGVNSFTTGDVLTFLLVIATGFLIATVMRVVLREDVLERLPVRHGIPFAVSTIAYYVLLVFIFMLALIAAGVELSKFTLFTGAFGIGVGFGLQNSINNFASGLILLFERPIREDDILEVEGTFGQVTRIGMRSTSIRTAEEAEVIVPNSSLVAGKVVNWSRLGRRRPVELVVRVAYGSNAAEVIELLEQMASTHEDVLPDPPAKAFLQGFGEKSLEFCLVFWVGRYHLHRSVLSDVAVRVHSNPQISQITSV